MFSLISEPSSPDDCRHLSDQVLGRAGDAAGDAAQVGKQLAVTLISGTQAYNFFLLAVFGNCADRTPLRVPPNLLVPASRLRFPSRRPRAIRLCQARLLFGRYGPVIPGIFFSLLIRFNFSYRLPTTGFHRPPLRAGCELQVAICTSHFEE